MTIAEFLGLLALTGCLLAVAGWLRLRLVKIGGGVRERVHGVPFTTCQQSSRRAPLAPPRRSRLISS